MKFSEWKTLTLAKLISLAKKYRDNMKAASDLNILIVRLHNAKVRDLSTILFYMHVIARDDNVPELLDIIPSPEELTDIISEKEE